MDGFALGEEIPGNAVLAAATPQLDYLFSQYPFCQLEASGLDVGLPDGQMGNSEVGHTNIGAGRVVFQDLPKISHAIEDGTLFENSAYLEAIQACKETGSALHLMGLLSDGGVHSHITHLYALLELAKRHGLEQLYIHVFLDGRDVSPTSGRDYVRQLQEKIQALGIGQIADVMGRYYAMDRDSRWNRLQRAYDAMVNGTGHFFDDPLEAIQSSYDEGITDEFMEPVICTREGRLNAGDGVIFYNFRPDRARELTRALVDPDFDKLKRKRGFLPLHFVCTTEYDATMPNVSVAFPHEKLKNIFGEYLSKLGLTQLRIAETEKYAHVTFFFNGGVETPNPGEDRILVNSPKVATYDLQPEMSAYEVTKKVLEAIGTDKYDLIILNFANADMVGHTGIIDAAKQAIEALDKCVPQIVDAILAKDGQILLTADHGNADVMLDKDGNTVTAHSLNDVPLLHIANEPKQLKDGGRLCDIAPTILKLMHLDIPAEMTGKPLV